MMTESSHSLAILCIDDEPMVTNALRTLLSQKLQEIKVIETAQGGEEALEIIEELEEDGLELCAVITDCIMPQMMGDELLIQIHQRLPHVKKIMLTGQSHMDRVVKAINEADLYRFIEKPWQNDDVILTLRGAITAYLQTQRLESQNQVLQKKSQDLEAALRNLQHTQLQMVQSEKMSALGNLVAGVGHEINNPVGFISGNVKELTHNLTDIFEHVDLYQQQASPEDIQEHAEDIDLDFLMEDMPKILTSMVSGCQRIRDISTSLRTFSRADTNTKIMANLHDGLDSTLLILKYRLQGTEHRPAIEVVCNYGDLPEIACFPGQLNQVFMNLLANAIDMFDEIAESQVGEQSYESCQTSPQQITIHTQALSNQTVEICIRDNGTGMSAEVLSKVFDSDFTTKAVGKGTGLGLAIAHQIVVHTHGGQLHATSEVGHGTAITIQLPSSGTD